MSRFDQYKKDDPLGGSTPMGLGTGGGSRERQKDLICSTREEPGSATPSSFVVVDNRDRVVALSRQYVDEVLSEIEGGLSHDDLHLLIASHNRQEPNARISEDDQGGRGASLLAWLIVMNEERQPNEERVRIIPSRLAEALNARDKMRHSV